MCLCKLVPQDAERYYTGQKGLRSNKFGERLAARLLKQLIKVHRAAPGQGGATCDSLDTSDHRTPSETSHLSENQHPKKILWDLEHYFSVLFASIFIAKVHGRISNIYH